MELIAVTKHPDAEPDLTTTSPQEDMTMTATTDSSSIEKEAEKEPLLPGSVQRRADAQPTQPTAPTDPQPAVEVVSLTPELAAEFLVLNERNRFVRPQVVAAYARSMKAGLWQLTGEAIKFDQQGKMIDGQHRCMGVVRSGVPIPVLVVRNVANGAQAVLDSGIKRQAYDNLSIQGFKNAPLVAATARLALKLEQGSLRVTNAEIFAWLQDNPRAHDAAMLAARYRTSMDMHTSVIALAWLWLSELDPDRAVTFLESIAQHQTDGPGDPRFALIRRFQTARRYNERIQQDMQMSMLVRSWNAWVEGKSMDKIPSGSKAGIIGIRPLVDPQGGPPVERAAVEYTAGYGFTEDNPVTRKDPVTRKYKQRGPKKGAIETFTAEQRQAALDRVLAQADAVGERETAAL